MERLFKDINAVTDYRRPIAIDGKIGTFDGGTLTSGAVALKVAPAGDFKRLQTVQGENLRAISAIATWPGGC